MLDSLSSCAGHVMTSIFPKAFTTLDYEITVPFDIRSLSYFNLLRAKTLWQTKARWSWFDKARKEDDDAGTRLGTLRFLPYEVRQQIFEIVLEDYFVAVEGSLSYQHFIFDGHRWPTGDGVNGLKLQLQFNGKHCCCKQDKVPNVLDLRSYFPGSCATEKGRMGLRLASPSIQQEFDYLFLSRCTFRFSCPFTIHRFLDQLSPIQQRQLKRLALDIFTYWRCSSDLMTCRDQWMTVCERLPPELTSVDLRSHRGFLRGVNRLLKDKPRSLPARHADIVTRLALACLDVVCKKVSRASPRAVIYWSGHEEVDTEESVVWDAGLPELENWSEDWHKYLAGLDV